MLGTETWKPEVDGRYHYLVDKADTYERAGGDAALIERARAALQAADDLRRHHETFGEWWSGSLPEAIWGYLHDAEGHLIEAVPDSMVSESMRSAFNHVAVTHYVGRDAVDLQQRPPTDPAALRRLSAEVVVRCHDITDAAHRTARRNRNLSTVISLVLFVGAAVVTGIQAFASGTMLPDPAGAMSTTVLVALVFVIGAIGGLISALAFEKRDPTVAGSTDLYAVSGPVAGMKTAIGAWTGIFGVWLTASGVIGLDYRSVVIALAVAFAFGFGQEPVTRYCTAWVTGLLKKT
jgi:hypothetical protein